MSILDNLQKEIDYFFSNTELLFEAVTHSSYSNEQNLNRNYERLEFLGDAVLQLIVSEYLIKEYKTFDEGILSMYRGYFVSEDFLSKIASALNLGSYVKLGKGEAQSGGKEKPSLLCDIFESLVAAIYLDGGYEQAKRVVLDLMINKIDDTISNRSFVDNKTELQKLTQKKFECLPEYEVISEEGPEHDKVFTIAVAAEGDILGYGKGKSKKRAEQNAAGAALKKLVDE
ncbi:ribonuclease III [Flexistipes sinusarabici]|uniref:ribonuclease III n=1 Tax=Flexistipes sinusarabici TaxID=2352 RepID=UPI0026EFE08A|nr:ribonuclease III [Flexistipes sinusarabici]